MKFFAQIAVFALLLTGLSGGLSSVAHATIVKKDVDYHLAGRNFQGYLAYNDALKGPRPGVLVTPDWMGMTDKVKARADMLADLGYVAFVADVYGKNNQPKNQEEAAQIAGGFKKDRILTRSHMQQGLKTLRDLPQVDKNRIDVIGYCFGGLAALELARAGADVKGVVTFHGSLDSPRPEDAKRIKGKILALHGADDPYVTAADVAGFETEMRNAKLDWRLVKYGNAVHSFTDKTAGTDNSKGAAYNADADRRSWIELLNFFKETID
jgi:dienelactone hydrolase